MNAERWARLTPDQRRRHHRWEIQNQRRRTQFDADHEGHEIIEHPSGSRPRTCLTCQRGDLAADSVMVQRAVEGRAKAADLLPAERLEAVRILTAKGHSAREIAGSLGMTDRLVVRDRARLRELGPAWQVAA